MFKWNNVVWRGVAAFARGSIIHASFGRKSSTLLCYGSREQSKRDEERSVTMTRGCGGARIDKAMRPSEGWLAK